MHPLTTLFLPYTICHTSGWEIIIFKWVAKSYFGWMKSFCFFNSWWKFPPKIQKSSNDFFKSLLLKMSVSYRNRTYNRVLGGPRYIHLTKETNAVFPGFFDPLAPAAIIYNSNTFVMNYLFLISSDFSDFASLSDPQTLPFFFKKVPPWFYLRRRTLYPTELQRFICFT